MSTEASALPLPQRTRPYACTPVCMHASLAAHSRAASPCESAWWQTCLENAGMTAPIHAVSWLKVVPPNVSGAEFALNRSMLACAYGPYNMRNEVDVHNTTVGGHHNNSHFLTGDGGFVQVLLNGYLGLMLAHQDGLQFNRPVLPAGAESLAVRGLRYLGFMVDLAVGTDTRGSLMMSWNASHPGLCLWAPPSGQGPVALRLGPSPEAVAVASFFDGAKVNAAHGRLGPCATLL